ncbi:MAG TPA: class I SAM-dependent methyltransferase [Planctomycetaceae bacterium]|nr:class I SAM-dependent methyltransferase [Planctomycetaceae bacterium]
MTTERNTGFRSLLTHASLYNAFQTLVGAKSARRWIVSHHIRATEGMTIVDIGCGTGSLRANLPSRINYYGFDPNSSYIEAAKAKYEGEFLAGVMSDFMRVHGEQLIGQVDLVTCMGVLHHLDSSQMSETLSASSRLLRPGGRFVGLEPAFLAKQDLLSLWVLKQDRGTSILADAEWQRLLLKSFSRSDVQITNNLLRIPYIHALLTGWQ